MSGLDRRPSRTPRKTREDRAFRLVLVGGTAAALAVVGFVLAIAGIVALGLPLIASAVAAICALLFRRNVAR